MKLFHSNKLIFFCLICAFHLNVKSQNLIPNGSFEETVPFQYEYPFSAFNYLEHWFNASFLSHDSSLVLSPDLFVGAYRVPESSPSNFWNVISGASDGNKYVGITNSAMYEGYFQPEAIGIQLKEKLTRDKYYYINLDYRNKGRDNITLNPMYCVEEDLKRLEFFFDSQKIYVDIHLLNKKSTSSSQQKVAVKSNTMKSFNLHPWKKIGTCFRASGNEAWMTMAMTVGDVDVYPPCQIFEEHYDAFFTYYFDVDNLELVELPEYYNINAQICEGRTVSIGIKDSINFPMMLDEILFEFENKIFQGNLVLNKAGKYVVDVIFDCTRIPLYINVENVDCTPKIYIPNIFSPNGDGLNDLWKWVVATDLEIINFELEVFSRLGNLLFKTKDFQDKWDGTFHGNQLVDGVYTFIVSYEYIDPELGKIRNIEKGDVTIIK